MCRRALRDAKSVTLGIGPDCRKKSGYNDDVSGMSEEERTTTNGLIHKAGIASDTGDVATIVACADAVEKLGLSKIADIIRKRYVKIRLERASDVQVFGWDRARGEYEVEGKTRNVIKVFTPWGSRFNDVRKRMGLRLRPVSKTVVDGVKVPFYWEADVTQGAAVLKCLAGAHAGEMALGDKGVFQIPGGAA
jgi:hypothetical protein